MKTKGDQAAGAARQTRPPRLNQPGTAGDDYVRVQANIERSKHRIWKGWAYSHGMTMKEMFEEAIEEKIQRISGDLRKMGLSDDRPGDD